MQKIKKNYHIIPNRTQKMENNKTVKRKEKQFLKISGMLKKPFLTSRKEEESNKVGFNSMFLQPIDQQYELERGKKRQNEKNRLNCSTDTCDEVDKTDISSVQMGQDHDWHEWDFTSNCTTASSGFYDVISNKKGVHTLFFSPNSNNNKKIKLSSFLADNWELKANVTKYKIYKSFSIRILMSRANQAKSHNLAKQMPAFLPTSLPITAMERELINKINIPKPYPVFR